MKRDYERYSYDGNINWKLLEAEADKLLPDIPRIEFGDGCINREIPVDINGSKLKYPKEPKPLSETPIEHVATKMPSGFCERCGIPRNYGAGHYCRSCYRLNAMDRRNARMKELRDTIIPAIEKQNEELVGGYDYWLSVFLYRSCPDFVGALLDAIEEAELVVGTPIAKWRDDNIYLDLFATDENRKPLFYSHDAALRMSAGITKEFIRYERPKWKVIRGLWGWGVKKQ
jgi:hypothetical protein